VAIHARLQELRREHERAQMRTGRARNALAPPKAPAVDNSTASR
jgi:hypothetical protein